jgi:predicted membrane channel-forming protein YqfA (hemolysin III family)
MICPNGPGIRTIPSGCEAGGNEEGLRNVFNKHDKPHNRKHTSDKPQMSTKMAKKQENRIGLEIKYQLSGWILFIVCAILFIASSLKNQDMLNFIGSVIFLIACILFLIPLIRSK